MHIHSHIDLFMQMVNFVSTHQFVVRHIVEIYIYGKNVLYEIFGNYTNCTNTNIEKNMFFN